MYKCVSGLTIVFVVGTAVWELSSTSSWDLHQTQWGCWHKEGQEERGKQLGWFYETKRLIVLINYFGKKKNVTEGNYSVWETWASAPNFDHLSKHQQGDLKRNEEILELWWCYNTEEDIVVYAPTLKQQLCKKNKKKMVWGWDAERYRCLNLNTFPDLNSVMRKIFKYSNQYLTVQWEYIKNMLYLCPHTPHCGGCRKQQSHTLTSSADCHGNHSLWRPAGTVGSQKHSWFHNILSLHWNLR